MIDIFILHLFLQGVTGIKIHNCCLNTSYDCTFFGQKIVHSWTRLCFLGQDCTFLDKIVHSWTHFEDRLHIMGTSPYFAQSFMSNVPTLYNLFFLLARLPRLARQSQLKAHPQFYFKDLPPDGAANH